MVANSSKLWETEQGKAIEYGNLIHEMFSKIISTKDVEKVDPKKGIFEMIPQHILKKKYKYHLQNLYSLNCFKLKLYNIYLK